MTMTADNNMQIPLGVIEKMRANGFSEDGIKQALINEDQAAAELGSA